MPEPKKDFISQEMNWLLKTIEWRWEKEFNVASSSSSQPELPKISSDSLLPYEKLVAYLDLTENQRLILALALAPFFEPEKLTEVVTASTLYKPIAFGARKFNESNLFVPTGTTALFLLAGGDSAQKLIALNELLQHPLFIDKLILITQEKVGGPMANGFLSIDTKLYEFLLGKNKLEEILPKKQL